MVFNVQPSVGWGSEGRRGGGGDRHLSLICTTVNRIATHSGCGLTLPGERGSGDSNSQPDRDDTSPGPVCWCSPLQDHEQRASITTLKTTNSEPLSPLQDHEHRASVTTPRPRTPSLCHHSKTTNSEPLSPLQHHEHPASITTPRP